MKNTKSLLEERVKFVDSTKKQNKYFKKISILIVSTIALLLFYLNE